MMSDDDRLKSPNTPSDADSNSNSGSLFSRRCPDESSSSSDGLKENTQLLLNNESTLSPKLQSHEAEITVRRCRLLDEVFPEGLKFQPRMTREESIDLATKEEKSSSDDEWFSQRIATKKGIRSIDGSKNSGNSQVSRAATREDIQRCMLKRLVEIRIKEQGKRKAMYDADNEIMFDGSKSLEIDLHKRTGAEKSETESNGENVQKNVGIKRKDEDVKCGFLEPSAAEQDNGDRVTSQENKLDDEKINVEDKNNDLEEQEVTTGNNVELNEAVNEDAAKDTSSEDQPKNWLQSGKEICESMMNNQDPTNHTSDGETNSANSSDEETDSEEYGSSTLVDDLLSDVAENCSGSFDYPEEETPKSLEYFDSKDYYRLMRKRSRKHRLMHSTKFYNSESIEAWRKSAVVTNNVRSLLSDEDDEGNGELLEGHGNKGDEIRTNKNAEDQRVEDMQEADLSSESEMVCEQQKRQKRSEYIDEEASLSGDDIGSDENNDDEEQLNTYEAEEGDNDEVPDDETIRDQLHKQWLKQQQDEEERKLSYWKDRLHVDGDAADETDRTFRFKLRLAKSEIVSKETDNATTVDAENIEIDDDELCRRRREISRWKVEWKAELSAKSTSTEGTNPLLNAASKVIDKGSLDGNSQSHEGADGLISKNSLLHHRKSLPQVLSQTKIYKKSAHPDSEHGDEYAKEQNAAKHWTLPSQKT